MVLLAEAAGALPGFASQRARPTLSHANFWEDLSFTWHSLYLPALERVLTRPHDRLNVHQDMSLSYQAVVVIFLASFLSFRFCSIFTLF
jgi:hypothetical protein